MNEVWSEVWSGILSGVGLAFALLVFNIAYSHYKGVKVISLIRHRLFLYYNEVDEDTDRERDFSRLVCFEAFVRELNVIVETRGRNLKDDELCGLLNRIRFFEAFIENRRRSIASSDLRLEEYRGMFFSIEKAEETKFLNFATKSEARSFAIPTINGNIFTNDR